MSVLEDVSFVNLYGVVRFSLIVFVVVVVVVVVVVAGTGAETIHI